MARGNLVQESTAMAIVGEKRGLFPELKRWVAEGRPVSDAYGFSMLQITLTLATV